MKTRKILLGLFLLVVLASLCFVACGGNDDTTTPAATTTAADVTTAASTTAADTTTAPTTTAPAGPVAIPGIEEVELKVSDDVTYTGSALKGNAYSLSNSREIQKYVNIVYSFAKIDAEGNVIAELTDRPIDAGRYSVTATFSFKEGYTAEQYILPEPISANIVIKPADATSYGFKMNDKTYYFVPGSSYTLALEGTLPAGVDVAYTIIPVKDAEGNAIANGTAVDAATAIGEYQVTAKFTLSTENFTEIADMTATLKVEMAPKNVIKYTPVMDGKVDQAYYSSAMVHTSTDLTQDPREYVLLSPIWVTAGNDSDYMHVTGTFYMLWDGDYIYFCAAMHDRTMYPRSNEYTMVSDPWLNENLEIYYLMGNDDANVAAGTETVGVAPNPRADDGKQIYPHYKGMSIDSLCRTKTAIYAQGSKYFNDIEVAGTHEPDGQGGYYYTLEIKFPAKQESFKMEEGYPSDPRKATEETLTKLDGRKLVAGDFVYFCFQIDDLNSWPTDTYAYPEVPSLKDDGTIDWAGIDAALQGGPIACYGNKTSGDASKFIYYCLTDTAYAVNVTVDGAADADYEKGITLTGTACDIAGLPTTAGTGANALTTKGVIGTDGKVYVHTNVVDGAVTKNDMVLYTLTSGDTTVAFTVDNTGAVTVVEGTVTVAPVVGTAANGYAHEFSIDLSAFGANAAQVEIQVMVYDADIEDGDATDFAIAKGVIG